MNKNKLMGKKKKPYNHLLATNFGLKTKAGSKTTGHS